MRNLIGRSIPVLTALAALFVATFATPAHATLVQINVTAQNNTGDALLNMAIPDAEIVSFSMLADVPPGVPIAVSFFNSASGATTWNNGGPQSMAITGGALAGIVSTGLADIISVSTPQFFGSTELRGFFVEIDIGVNPFSTSEEFADLLLTSTVVRFFAARGSSSNTGGGPIELDILAFDIAPGVANNVPAPASSLAFLILGAAVLGLWRRT